MMLSAISAISAAPWKIAGVLGLALALIAGGCALYLKGRSAGVAQERAAAEQAKAEALAHAQALSDELIIAQAAAMALTERTVTVYRDRITNAPKTNTCGPVLRDAARGVLDTLNPGGGEAPAGRDAAPAVPAAQGRGRP